MPNYRLPELRDSPFSQLMASLPQLLMRMKENQTAQANKDREFLQSQKQQVQQQANLVEQRKIQTKKDKLSIFTELLSSEDDPSTKAGYLRLMSNADPENMGSYASLAEIQDIKGVERDAEEGLVKKYAAGEIDAATFYGEIESPWALDQGFEIEKNSGNKTYSYGGWLYTFNRKTGKGKKIRIGGDPNLQFYKDEYKKISEALIEGFITEEEAKRLEGGKKFYGNILENLGVDIFKGDPLGLK